MLSKYFNVNEWKAYFLGLIILIWSILVFGIFAPSLISSKSNILVTLGVVLILVVWPIVSYIFGKPLFNKMRRILK